MGRARKPADMQTKHLTQEEKEKLKQAEDIVTVGREDLKTPPIWLINKDAKKEFKRIVKEFEKIEVIGNLDLNNIAGYCNAYANYKLVLTEIKDTPMVVKGEINRTYEKLKKMLLDYGEDMRKFGACCGLTIDSRLKVGTVKVSKTGEEITNEFGDI